MTLQPEPRSKSSRYRNQRWIAAATSITGSLCFVIANSLGVFKIPYMPLAFSFNTAGTAIVAVYLVYLVWANHGRSCHFLLFTSGLLLLIAGKICELAWFPAVLGVLGIGGTKDYVAIAIDHSLADLGYCSFAWAIALLSINAIRHEQTAQENERQLRLSEERYRRLVELTPNWIFETSHDGVIELTNGALEPVLGYPPNDLEGRELISLVEPAHREDLVISFQKALSGQRQTDLEIRFIHKKTGFRWLSLNLVAVVNGDGTIGGVQGDGRDITIGRETAEALQRRERHLSCLAEIQASLLGHPGMQGLFERILPRLGRTSGVSRISVFENLLTPDGSMVLNKKGEWCAEGIPPGIFHPLGQNYPYLPALARWMDKLKLNQSISGVVTTFPDCEREYLESEGTLSVLALPLIAAEKWFGFLRFDDCQREREWGITEVGPLRSAAAAISLAIGRAHEEEDKNALERKLLESQKLESLGVLAGGIAHDFNNLLTTIMGNANLACDLLPEDSPVRQHLLSIDSATQRAADLAHQMLAYTGRGQLTSTRFDINDTARELLTLLTASLSKKINLACHLPEDLPLVEGDPTQIRQVIMNLVLNAAEAIGDGNGTVTIRSNTESVQEDPDQFAPALLSPTVGEYVTLEVSDTGCGMDSKTLERIFDPFFTTKVTGHGLGLAAVHGIIRSHGGGLRVQSTMGSGTSFVVYLPAHERPIISTNVANKAESGTGSGTILVADDEEDVRDLVESVLIRGGYSVITVCDGIQALNTFKELQDEVDAVILDLSMPNLNGVEVLSEIRTLSATVPVILSSGFNEGDVTIHFSESLASGFIHKPYRPKALLDIVSEVLSRKPS